MRLQAFGQQFRNKCFSLLAKSIGVGNPGRRRDSILVVEPGARTGLAGDFTSWRQEVALPSPRGFQVSGRDCLQSYTQPRRANRFIQRSLITPNENRFLLHHPLTTDNFTFEIKTLISTSFPLSVTGDIAKVRIESVPFDDYHTTQGSLNHTWGNFPGRSSLQGNHINLNGRVVARFLKSYIRDFLSGGFVCYKPANIPLLAPLRRVWLS